LFAQSKRDSFDTGLTNISIRPGFLDVSKSEFSYNNGTRTLLLSPIAPETAIKARLFSGLIIERASFSWINADIEGRHYFYIDDEGAEQVSSSPNREAVNNFLRSNISSAEMEWGDASFNEANIIIDTRKKATGMSPETTAKNYFDIPVYALDGVAVTSFPESPTGDIPTDAQFGFSTDELLFADRQYDFPPFSRGDTWRVLYIEGTVLRSLSKPLYAFATGSDFGLAENKPVYNNSGTPAFVDPPNSSATRYVYYIMSVVPDITPENRMIAIMGDLMYDSVGEAEEGLKNEVTRAKGISALRQGKRDVYAVLYEIKDTYSNAHNVLAKSITTITSETGLGGTSSLPPGLSDGGNADLLHKHEAQALQASTIGVNDTDDTVYLADGAGVIKKADFQTKVSSNTDVTANTAKVTNATHTGEVTGSGVLTVDPTAISNKSTTATLDGTEEVLLNNGGTLEKTTTQDIADLGGGGTGYTPPSTTNAVVDTNALTADTVTNTLVAD